MNLEARNGRKLVGKKASAEDTLAGRTGPGARSLNPRSRAASRQRVLVLGTKGVTGACLCCLGKKVVLPGVPSAADRWRGGDMEVTWGPSPGGAPRQEEKFTPRIGGRRQP